MTYGYAWQPELAVCFRKGVHFAHAIDDAHVPSDMASFNEALNLWGNWVAQEQFAEAHYE
jgi:hypothetical protein